MKGVRKNATVQKLSATKSKGDGVMITGKVVAFNSPDFKNEYATYKLMDNITLLPINVKNLEPRPNLIRINEKTGLREARFRITTTQQDKVTDYFAYHVDQEKNHGRTYTGPVPNYRDFWDDVNGKLATHTWHPIEDALGNSPLLTLKLWRGEFPPDMKVGSIINVAVTFDQYVAIPKARGVAVAIEKANEERKKMAQLIQASTATVSAPWAGESGGNGGEEPAAPTAPSAGSSDDDHKRHPTISLNLAGNSGISYNENNKSDCTPLQAFGGDFDNRRHFLRLPESQYDSMGLVVPFSEYQCYDSWDLYEPGPSTARSLDVSYDARDYQKAPKGEDPEKTLVREEKKTVSVNVLQYNGKIPDPETEFPFTVQFSLFKSHTMGTGITNLDHWTKFGRLKWQGLAVVSVDAVGTRNIELNKLGINDKEKNQWAGQLDCWTKAVFWDVESSVRSFGFPVKDKKALLSRLYADIYSEATSTKKGTVLTLPMHDLGRRLPNGNALLPNPLHVAANKSRAINLGEWSSDAGWIVSNDNYDLYVLLHLPIPPELVADRDACEEYTESTTKVFQDMEEGDFIDVILGESTKIPKVTVAGAKRDVLVYHPDELACFKAIEDDEKRALALPGRGPQPREYADRPQGAKPPSSYGFDFLVYAIHVPDEEPQKRETKKMNKKK